MSTVKRESGGRFGKGNRAAALRESSDLSRANMKRAKIARILAESLTTKDIKDAVREMLRVIREGANRDKVAAFRTLMEVAATRPSGGGEPG